MGFDDATSRDALLRYNGSAWIGVANTNSLPISNEKSYFVYIRGERTKGVTGSYLNSSATTLRTKGTLFTGTQITPTIPVPYGVVGNPYVSAIDFTQLTRESNVSNLFYIYDSKRLVGAGTSLGQYITFSAANSFQAPTGGGSYTLNQVNTKIESGQAFMVQATAAGSTITIPESSKIASSTNYGFRPSTPSTDLVKIDSRLYNGTAANSDLIDANVVVFNNRYSNAVNGDDALKLANPSENFALLKESKTIVIEARPQVTADDTIYFKLWNLKQQAYRFDFVPLNLGTSRLTASLEDSYLATSTPIDLSSANNPVNFAVDANPASFATNRFRIVFKPAAPTVSFVSLNANYQAAVIKVDWKVAGEAAIQRYEVERSADGNSFIKVGAVTANENAGGNNSYSWLDNSPLTSNSFYRIKSVAVSGEIKYTYIVKVLIGKAAFVVSPNPVEGSFVNLQFKNQIQGRYNVRLLTSAGQVVMISVVEHAGGNSVQILKVPASIARGAYQLEIISPDKTTTVQNLFINTK